MKNILSLIAFLALNLAAQVVKPWPEFACSGADDCGAKITAIGSTNATLVIAKTYTISSNKTIPANIHVRMTREGSFAKTHITDTLFINGTFESGGFACFQSGLIVRLSNANAWIDSRWWAEKARFDVEAKRHNADTNRVALSAPYLPHKDTLFLGSRRASDGATVTYDTSSHALSVANNYDDGEQGGSILVSNPYGYLVLDEDGNVVVSTGALGLVPAADLSFNLGNNIHRWVSVYAGSGEISYSFSVGDTLNVGKKLLITGPSNTSSFLNYFSSASAYNVGANSTWRTAEFINASTTSGAAAGIAFEPGGQFVAGLAGVRDGSNTNQGGLALIYGNGSTFTEGARLTYNGNFLIGSVVDSGQKLQVAGSARLTGGINAGSDININGVLAGSDISERIKNLDNTSTGSHARLDLIVGGASGGDAFTRYDITGIQAWTSGIDNRAPGDPYVISPIGLPDTSNAAAIFRSDKSTRLGGRMEAGGAFVDKTATLTSNTTLSASTNSVIFADATGGSFTVTLPTSVGNEGLTYKIFRKDVGTSNHVDIASSLGQFIGAYGSTILGPNIVESSLSVISDGANWQILEAHEYAFFTFTLTGVSGTVTGTGYYYRNSGSVVFTLPSTSGTSNATTFTITGIPSVIRPAATKLERVTLTDNGTTIGALASLSTGGTITFSTEVATGTPVTFNSSGFTSSGTKGIGGAGLTMTYVVGI